MTHCADPKMKAWMLFLVAEDEKLWAIPPIATVGKSLSIPRYPSIHSVNASRGSDLTAQFKGEITLYNLCAVVFTTTVNKSKPHVFLITKNIFYL